MYISLFLFCLLYTVLWLWPHVVRSNCHVTTYRIFGSFSCILVSKNKVRKKHKEESFNMECFALYACVYLFENHIAAIHTQIAIIISGFCGDLWMNTMDGHATQLPSSIFFNIQTTTLTAIFFSTFHNTWVHTMHMYVYCSVSLFIFIVFLPYIVSSFLWHHLKHIQHYYHHDHSIHTSLLSEYVYSSRKYSNCVNMYKINVHANKSKQLFFHF